MIAIFLFIVLGIVIIPLIVKGFIFVVCILLPLITSAYFIVYFKRKSRFDRMKRALDGLASQEGLKRLNIEERKRLARLIDLYIHNRKQFKQSFKDDLLWAGVGYAAASMGMERAARVGIGYTMVRRYVKPAMRKALENKEEYL